MTLGRISAVPVSLFADFRSTQPIGTVDLIEWLTSDHYKEQATKIRQTDNKRYKKRLKSLLPCVTPSGIFSKRAKGGLLQHSGLIGIDIDTLISHKNGDLLNLKAVARNLPYVLFACDSVGGFGSFWLIPIEDTRKHAEYYRAIAQELHAYGITVDAACSDVSRLRCATYDPNPYINPDALPFKLPKVDPPKAPVRPIECASGALRTASTGDVTAWRVEALVEAVAHYGADMTDRYQDWYAIGQSLASEFGERGRGYFHTVSRQSSKYQPERCDAEFDKCLHNCSRMGIGTFFWYCSQSGLSVSIKQA